MGVYGTTVVIGATPVVAGTSTRILYNNAGVVGEYTLTGTGTVVVMQTTPTIAGQLTLSASYNASAPAITSTGNLTSGFAFSSGNVYYSSVGTSVGAFHGTYGFIASGTKGYTWTSGNADASAPDTTLIRGGAAATVQLGNDVNGAAVAQTFQACNGITGTDRAGANLTIRCGAGTGAGTVSAVIIQTPAVRSTGTTAQTQTTRVTITEGSITIADATDVVVNATTGTKWGTAPGQKQAWWGSTPVVQQVLATGAAHTVDDVITLLQTLGLCKQS